MRLAGNLLIKRKCARAPAVKSNTRRRVLLTDIDGADYWTFTVPTMPGWSVQ